MEYEEYEPIDLQKEAEIYEIKQKLFHRLLELADKYLTPLQRNCIYGTYVDNLTQQNIAFLLGLRSQSSITKALSNGKTGTGAYRRLARIAAKDEKCIRLLSDLRNKVYDESN